MLGLTHANAEPPAEGRLAKGGGLEPLCSWTPQPGWVALGERSSFVDPRLFGYTHTPATALTVCVCGGERVNVGRLSDNHHILLPGTEKQRPGFAGRGGVHCGKPVMTEH